VRLTGRQTEWESGANTQVNRLPAILFIALIVLMLCSLTVGRYAVSLADVVRVVLATNPISADTFYDDKAWVAVIIVRMPRVLLATICGMGLALSGAAMQGVFRNPLIGPEIAGVSSGAALGGVVAIVLGYGFVGVVGLSFATGLLALAGAFALAVVAGRANTLALVLSGVVVGGFCSALVGLVQTIADPATKLPSIIFWLLGSFADATYDKATLAAAVTLLAGGATMALRWRINVLSLGDDDAKALGINVAALRWILLSLVAVMVAAQVSVSGGVGWIGLIIPHFARLLVGPDHVRLLPTAAALGGIYLLAMDTIARSAIGQEIPIGLLTSAIGAPVFALMLWRNQNTQAMRTSNSGPRLER
jgi:iron complex transport system permease protein